MLRIGASAVEEKRTYFGQLRGDVVQRGQLSGPAAQLLEQRFHTERGTRLPLDACGVGAAAQ